MPGRRPPFTFVELLAVGAVISVLAACLLPALGKARDAAYRAACLSNLRNLAVAFTAYSRQFDNYYPPVSLRDPELALGLHHDTPGADQSGWVGWQAYLGHHLIGAAPKQVPAVFQCPFDHAAAPGNPLFPGEGPRGDLRVSYARFRPDGVTESLLQTAAPLRREERGRACYSWPYRFGDFRCATTTPDGQVRCAYDCDVDDDRIMANAPERVWLVADNHRGKRQGYRSWDTMLSGALWWQPPASAGLPGAGEAGHGTAHRGGARLHGLAYDGHAEGLRSDRRPHTSYRLTQRAPGVMRWYRETATGAALSGGLINPPIAYDGRGYSPVAAP